MKEIQDITEIQNILFDTLCYFDAFCRERDLNYFLSNGSLLGAAKYGDFIPWDDDVDILMPREDYDRLIKFHAINSEKYRLFVQEQVPEWRMPYAKLSDMRTFFREGEYDFGADIGLSIDIFPLDYWSPMKPFAYLEAIKGELLKRFLITSIGGKFQTKRRGIKKWILKFIWYIGRKIGHDRVLRNIKKSVQKSRGYQHKYIGCVAWTCHLTSEVLLASIFAQSVMLPIKDREFPAPIGFEEYLDALYGRWREELSPEKRHSNHEIKVWWRHDR